LFLVSAVKAGMTGLVDEPLLPGAIWWEIIHSSWWLRQCEVNPAGNPNVPENNLKYMKKL
jgi:hypothetical protein